MKFLSRCIWFLVKIFLSNICRLTIPFNYWDATFYSFKCHNICNDEFYLTGKFPLYSLHSIKSCQLWRYLWRKKSKICDRKLEIVTEIHPSKFHWSQIHLWRSVTIVLEYLWWNFPVTIICDGKLRWTKFGHKKMWQKLQPKNPICDGLCDGKCHQNFQAQLLVFKCGGVFDRFRHKLWQNAVTIVGQNRHFDRHCDPKIRQSHGSLLIATENCDGFHHRFDIATEFRQKVGQIPSKQSDFFFLGTSVMDSIDIYLKF